MNRQIYLLIFLWSILAVGCKKDDHEQSSEIIKSVVTQPDKTELLNKETIYFAFITRYNPRVMFDEYEPIIDYLSHVTKYKFELKLGKTYDDEVQLLYNQEAQVVSFGAVTYLCAHKLFNAKPILRTLNKDGLPFYRSVFIVRDDSDIESLSDIKGRTLALASPHSTSGNLIPRYELFRNDLSVDDLGDYQNFKHHDSVVKKVLRGEFDAGAVKDVVAYRYLSMGLRIIHVSEDIPSVPIAVHPEADTTLIHTLESALLRIGSDSTLRAAITREWNEEFRYGFVRASDSDYDGIREKLRQIPGGCSQGCHPGPEL